MRRPVEATRTYFRGFNALDTFTIDNYNVLLYRKIIELEPTRELEFDLFKKNQ